MPYNRNYMTYLYNIEEDKGWIRKYLVLSVLNQIREDLRSFEQSDSLPGHYEDYKDYDYLYPLTKFIDSVDAENLYKFLPEGEHRLLKLKGKGGLFHRGGNKTVY